MIVINMIMDGRVGVMTVACRNHTSDEAYALNWAYANGMGPSFPQVT